METRSRRSLLLLWAGLLLWGTILAGCASSQGKFSPGETLVAQRFSNYPHLNGTPVRVVAPLEWRWVKKAHSLRVYEVETIDGQRLAAQEFQLRRPK